MIDDLPRIAGVYFIVFFTSSTMQVHTTLTKKCRFGISEWTFGQLSSGWLAAIGPRGKKIFFRNLDQMDVCLQKFINDYHYKKQSTELVQQLSLAI